MKRVDVMVDLAVIAASIGVAIVIHRPVVHCSYTGPCPHEDALQRIIR